LDFELVLRGPGEFFVNPPAISGQRRISTLLVAWLSAGLSASYTNG
jgi:hypothetical protein